MNLSAEIVNFLFLLLIPMPLCFLLSRDSLRYYAQKNGSSSGELEKFLTSLSAPLRPLYKGLITSLQRAMPEKRQPPSTRLMLNRLLTAVLPFAMIVAATIGYIRAISEQQPLHINYPLHIFFMLLLFIPAWRFGHSLNRTNTK